MLFNWVQPLFNRYAQRCAKGVTRGPQRRTPSRRNVYVNPLERAYVAIVHRRWLNKTFYMPTKS